MNICEKMFIDRLAKKGLSLDSEKCKNALQKTDEISEKLRSVVSQSDGACYMVDMFLKERDDSFKYFAFEWYKNGMKDCINLIAEIKQINVDEILKM